MFSDVEMVQLRALTRVPFSEPHQWFTTMYNSRARESEALFLPTGVICISNPQHTNTHKNNVPFPQ